MSRRRHEHKVDLSTDGIEYSAEGAGDEGDVVLGQLGVEG
jgi:hypothetical protein